MFHIIYAEQLLEGHTSDTGYGIQSGKGQSGYAHGHEALRNVYRDSEHFQESCHTGGKDLERSAHSGCPVGACGSSCHAEGDDGQKAFQNHGAVSDFQHIFFIGDGLGGGSGRYQTMETGYRTAGDGYKKNGKQGPETFVFKACEYRKIHGRMCKNQSDDSADDHSDEHKRGHVISWLHQKPHGKDGCQENIGKRDIDPHIFAESYRQIHSAYKSQYGAYQTEDHFFPAFKLRFSLNQTKDGGKQNEKQGNTSGCSVDSGIFRQRAYAVGHHIGIERIGHHIGKGCDDDQGKQPAESEEQLPSCLADVFFDQKSHGLAVIHYTGVQSAEVGHGAEEDAAQDDPKKDRQPAECSCLNGSGDRTGAGNGRKLMGKHGPSIGGHVVLSVVMYHSRGFGLRVDAPFFCQPTSVQCVCCYETDGGDQHDYKCVHDFHLSFSMKQ